MSFRRIINKLLVVLLTVGLLASSASTFNYAWCVSANGDHFVLEFAPTSDCALDERIPTAENLAPASFNAGRDGCGSCDDISSPPHWRSKRSRVLNAKLLLPPPASDQAVDALSLLDSRVLPGQFSSPSPPRVPDAILLHRTVVLLI